MLALLGLMGLLMTGMVVDVPGLFNSDGGEAETSDQDEAEMSQPQGEDGTSGGLGSLLDTPETEQDTPDPLQSNNPNGTIQLGEGGDDTLLGSSGADQIHGVGGDDTIGGFGEDDHLRGGDGNDRISGGDDNDTIYGDHDDDILHGDDGDDLIYGGADDDSLYGDEGDDDLHGGQGSDYLDGGAGNDSLLGGYGNDSLVGGEGTDTMMGGEGDDTLYGIGLGSIDDSTTDFLNGGEGDDRLVMGSGDIANGGTGSDIFELGDWVSGEEADIRDFDMIEDQIVISVAEDALDASLLEVSVDSNTGNASVILNGEVIAEVADAAGLTSDMITLVAR